MCDVDGNQTAAVGNCQWCPTKKQSRKHTQADIFVTTIQTSTEQSAAHGVTVTLVHIATSHKVATSDKVCNSFVTVSMLMGACLLCRPRSHSAEEREEGEGGCHEHHHTGRHEGDCSKQAGLD